jgi:hypothetical protein
MDMGRPERPIDPTAGPLPQLAYQLRQLRQVAGRPSYRALSSCARYSVTALSEAAGGEVFPTLPVTLAYVAACGGNRDEWEARWRAVAQELVANGQLSLDGQVQDVAETEPAPYLGLAAFQPDDVERFFAARAWSLI